MKKILIILAIIVAILAIDVGYLNLRSPEQPYGGTAGSLVPTQNNAYDVGISSLRWRDGWFTRNLTVGGNITSTGGSVNLTSLTTGTATVTGALSALNAAITGGLSSATHVIGVLNGVLKAVSGNITLAVPNTDYLAYSATPAVGDIITWNGTAWVSLPGSTAGYVLTTNGSATIPYFSSAQATAINVGSTALKNSNDASRNTTSLTPVKLKEIKFNEAYSGTMTIAFTMTRGGGGSGSIHGQVYKNGVAFGTLFNVTAGGDASSETLSISIVPNDLLQVYAYMDASAVLNTVTNFRLSYSYRIIAFGGYTLEDTLIYAVKPTVSVTNQDP